MGNGPSLTVVDLDAFKLNGIFTFGCNRINLIFNDTGWGPDVWARPHNDPFAGDLGNHHLHDFLIYEHQAQVKRTFVPFLVLDKMASLACG